MFLKKIGNKIHSIQATKKNSTGEKFTSLKLISITAR